MRHESHTKTLIALVREHTAAWRKSCGWSRETMVDAVVQAHDHLDGPAATGIRFEPQTRDTFERMKVNADRVFRWLDDETKDTNLLPANFLQSVLAALPHDRRRHCVDDILRPLGLAVRSLELDARAGVDVAQVTNLMREQTEASAAAAALLDGDATPDELMLAHRELSESIVAARGVRATVEVQMQAVGLQIPPKEADPS
jgi:hypothetical protein